MAKYAIIRLGKDSVADIEALDALNASPHPPLAFDITCSQVPMELAVGDFAFICLGSDNNNGIPTTWVRGLRALGTITGKTGGPGYNNQWIVSLEVKVALSMSITKMNLLAVAPHAYYWAAEIPVLGVDTHSNQTIQMIKTSEPNQNIDALLYALNAIQPTFRPETIAAYPSLEPRFKYSPPSPTGLASPLQLGAIAGAQLPSSGYPPELSKIVEQFKFDADAADLRVESADIHRFLASLLSKRFLIASGLAGSGKTKLAQAFALWLTRSTNGLASVKDYEVIPVGAEWTGNENILGYPNGLDDKAYVSKPALNLMLRAMSDALIPHVLILDEMNLSHVERYFADVLSVIESNEKIMLHNDGDRMSHGMNVPNDIALSKNLFIIGTVNVDETTYMFSPKVLDRANVIEFRMGVRDLETFLVKPNKPDLSSISGKGAGFGQAFVQAASLEVPTFVGSLKDQYEAEMLLFFQALKSNGAEFGYRVAYEAARFIYFYRLLGGHDEADQSWFPKAFDFVVAQKFLPKLHGSRAKLGPLLKKLWYLCVSGESVRGLDALAEAENAARSTEKSADPSMAVPQGARYLVSAEKIGRMWRLLNDNGFASFAEA